MAEPLRCEICGIERLIHETGIDTPCHCLCEKQIKQLRADLVKSRSRIAELEEIIVDMQVELNRMIWDVYQPRPTEE